MKHKEAISAVIGTAFFAIPYIGLSITLAPSLVIGAAAYGASELLFSTTKKLNEINNDKSLKEILSEARKNNNYLISKIKLIDSLSTKNSLGELTDTISKIINTIEKEPKKIKRTDNFFEYYLPALVRIVDRYDEIENQQLNSKEGKAFINNADNMIKEANVAFKNLLDNLYQSDIVDGGAEMKVFNSMLKSDGLSREIVVGSKENNDEDK